VFPQRYAQFRESMIRFLEANGLEHRLGGNSVVAAQQYADAAR
jgi:hypothetical protein